jgi:4-carboxymuconolactone decarboxylase
MCAAQSTMAMRGEIQEVLLQTAVYCGVLAALESFKVTAEVFAEEASAKDRVP